MPQRTAHRGDTVSYRNADGETINMIVQGEQVAAPAQPTSSTSATGGTVPDGTMSYRVSAVVDGIESPASVAKTQVTTGGGLSTVTINWVANARATAHKVYGRTGGSELLIATVAAPTVTYIDTGAITPAGALPAADGRVSLWSPYGAAINPVLKATAMKQTNVYYNR